MKVARIACLCACSLAVPPLYAGTIVDVGGQINGSYTTFSRQAEIVSWTSTQAYANVSIGVKLNTAAASGVAYVTNSIGPGTNGSNVVAQSNFSVPHLGNVVDTLFSGLNLFPGTYYLTLYVPGSGSIGWDYSNTPSITAGTGVTVNNFGFALAGGGLDPAFAPDSTFIPNTPVGQQLQYVVTGDAAVLPTTQAGGTYTFNNVASGQWFDPATAWGFDFTMTSGSHFTSILNFPSGFTDPFMVSSGGVNLGLFFPGQSFVFAGGGVSNFEITGINPRVDPSNPVAFPLQLAFDTPTATFTMTGFDAPEPTSAATAGTALLGLLVLGCSTLRRKSSPK